MMPIDMGERDLDMERSRPACGAGGAAVSTKSEGW
jgi:hypothetical protein